jgi:hypothetical protein
MPTVRKRYAVTETDHVAEALDAAARRWPADRDNRSKLLLHLIDEGYSVITHSEESEAVERLARRRVVVERTAGKWGPYPKDYLKELHEEWPE